MVDGRITSAYRISVVSPPSLAMRGQALAAKRYHLCDHANQSMSEDAKRKLAAECWRKGNEALPKENWDYAIQMYFTSAKVVPDNLMYRQSLRGAEYKKYGDNKKGAAMASMKLMGTKGKIKKCRMSKDWAGV